MPCQRLDYSQEKLDMNGVAVGCVTLSTLHYSNTFEGIGLS